MNRFTNLDGQNEFQGEFQEYWGFADAKQAELIRRINRRWSLFGDEVQEVLERFRSRGLFRFLTRKETEALHRKIKSWKEQGYSDSYQLLLYLNAMEKRGRIRQEEALFLWIFALSWGAHREILAQDIPILTQIAQETYRRERAGLQAVLGESTGRPPAEQEIKKYLALPLPDGTRLDRQLSDYAQYLARRLTDAVQNAAQQGRTPDIDSPEFQKLLQAGKNRLLKPSQSSGGQPGGFHGYLDRVMTSVTGHTVMQVFQQSGVKQYKFLAVLDGRTTHACQWLHGKLFQVANMKLGVNVPPITVDYEGQPIPHPCRSIIRAVFEAEQLAKAIRSAGKEGQERPHTFRKLGTIDAGDEKAVQYLIEEFENRYTQSKKEHCLVIAENGDVYLIDGDKNTVDTSLLGDRMKGSVNTHNHPASETQYSFSDDDIVSFLEDGSRIMRAFDERYVYEVSRPENPVSIERFLEVYSETYNKRNTLLWEQGLPESMFELESQHAVIQKACEEFQIPYRRWEK